MNKPLWQSALLAFAVLAFSCLLLGGGSRLIAMPEEGAMSLIPPPAVMKASLTCPPMEQAQTLHAQRAQERQFFTDASIVREDGEIAFRLPQTDANGNILRQTSYMRAVYQVFALGDGFA